MYAMRAPPATTAAEDGSDADVLVPELRVLGDETRHHPDARGILQDLDGDAARTQVRFLARERAVLAGDHVRDAVQQDCAAAHRARREGRVEHRRAVDGRGLASGILERVHLAVQNRASALGRRSAALHRAARDLAREIREPFVITSRAEALRYEQFTLGIQRSVVVAQPFRAARDLAREIREPFVITSRAEALRYEQFAF